MVEEQDIKVTLQNPSGPGNQIRKGLEAYRRYSVEHKIDDVHKLALIMTKSKEFSRIHNSYPDTAWKQYQEIRYSQMLTFDYRLTILLTVI